MPPLQRRGLRGRVLCRLERRLRRVVPAVGVDGPQAPMRRACAALAIALLAGCALFPLKESDCVGVDWRKRGYADGYGGHPQQFLRLQQECRRFGVEVNETEYFAGWKDGYDEWYRLIGSMDRIRR